MAKIKLNQEKLFEVSNKLAVAYKAVFSADTISRASQFVEGVKNPSRNYMWGIIINTQLKGKGKLSDYYQAETARSLVKLTIYKLAQPSAESQEVEI